LGNFIGHLHGPVEPINQVLERWCHETEDKLFEAAREFTLQFLAEILVIQIISKKKRKEMRNDGA
jgi:hypothetical protein